MQTPGTTFAFVKTLFVILALLILAKPVLPVIEYWANYDYIALELCENKAKPQMQCNGKCHLMKELAKASEAEKPVSEKKMVHHEAELLFCEAVAAFDFATPGIAPAVPQTHYTNLYSHIGVAGIFHPPAII